jgi:hypothetical protein
VADSGLVRKRREEKRRDRMSWVFFIVTLAYLFKVNHLIQKSKIILSKYCKKNKLNAI